MERLTYAVYLGVMVALVTHIVEIKLSKTGNKQDNTTTKG